MCVFRRRKLFVDARFLHVALDQILQSAARHGFAVAAYCFMPDQLHLLVEAEHETAGLIPLAREIKQRVAFAYQRTESGPVWQKGFYERVLRDDEASLTVAKYIFSNPVRAGLVEEPRDYPFSGSSVWTWSQLLEIWQTEASASCRRINAGSTEGLR